MQCMYYERRTYQLHWIKAGSRRGRPVQYIAARVTNSTMPDLTADHLVSSFMCKLITQLS